MRRIDKAFDLFVEDYGVELNINEEKLESKGYRQGVEDVLIYAFCPARFTLGPDVMDLNCCVKNCRDCWQEPYVKNED